METQIQAVSGEQLAIVTHDQGPKVVAVQRVGWKRLEDASEARLIRHSATIRELGGTGFVQGLIEARDKAKAESAESAEPDAPADPLDSYDISILLAGGVSKVDSKAPKAGDAEAWTPELATEAARCILKLSRPMLFESEGDRKNG